jgi:hypothetical protein
MDSKKFFGKIREIIREEIDYALEKKLMKPEVKTKVVSESKSREADLVNSAKKIANIDSKPKRPISNYSSINELLEETKRSLNETHFYDNDDDTMYFTSDSVNSSFVNQAAIPNGVSPEKVPSEVMNALTRNYSDLMKKIDEKKGR